jgi:1-phosphofructokinase family hexose kinase
MIVTATLNPTIDIIAPVDALIPGRVLRSKNIFSHPGGKGTNTARALAALGTGVTACGFAGKKHFTEMNSFLKKYGVKPDFTAVPGSNRLCLLINGRKNETVINSESNITVNAKQRRAFLKKIKQLSYKTAIFIFSGSLPLALPGDFYADCIRATKGRSVSVLDAHSGSLRLGIKAGPDIVKANIHEFESAFGIKLGAYAGASRKTFKKFIAGLSGKYAIKVIIVTLGKQGSVLYSAGVFTRIQSFKVKEIISPVGCGDAYSAGLAYGIEKGMKMADCCRLGAACAAANLGHQGSCFIGKKEVVEFLPRGFL